MIVKCLIIRMLTNRQMNKWTTLTLEMLCNWKSLNGIMLVFTCNFKKVNFFADPITLKIKVHLTLKIRFIIFRTGTDGVISSTKPDLPHFFFVGFQASKFLIQNSNITKIKFGTKKRIFTWMTWQKANKELFDFRIWKKQQYKLL